jgi:hypothetical protein
MRALLTTFAAVLILITTQAHALNIDAGQLLTLEIQGDLTMGQGANKVKISAPWTIQSLNLVNDNEDGQPVVIHSLEASASCLDESNSQYVEVYSPNFDVTDMNVRLEPQSTSFSTGELYIYDLPACRNGHVIQLSAEGVLLDSNGEEDWSDSSSVTFISQ